MTESLLRKNPLWQTVNKLCHDMYAVAAEIETQFPDEKWTTVNRMHTGATDSIFYTSQALGNLADHSSEFDWRYAHKSLFALQSMYLFATKQKFVTLNPDTVIEFDKTLTTMSQKIDDSVNAAASKETEDMQPWLEKYRLWQKLNQ